MTVKQLPIMQIASLDAGFCEVCGSLIVLNIEKFKAQNCTQCESYIETCRGAGETIPLCKECCHEDFIEQGNSNSRAFFGIMTSNEDREESDLQIGRG